MTAFHVIGIVFTAWALVIAFLGITRPGFPGDRGGERVVIVVSIVLALAAIGSAIVVGALEEEEHAEGEAAVLPV